MTLITQDPQTELQTNKAPGRQPLAEFVNQAITTIAQGNENTGRAYFTGAGLFLQYLGLQLATDQPPATPTKQGKRTIWEFRGSAAILAEVTPKLLYGFKTWRLEQGDKHSTAEQRYRAARSLLSMALSENILPMAEAYLMGITPYRPRNKKIETPVGRRLSPAEVKQLRAAVATTTNKGKRDIAILDLMLYAGLRRSEAASLASENITQDSGRHWLQISGKGDKPRRVKIHDQLYKSLASWAEVVGLQLGTDSGPIFRNVAKGDKLTNNPLSNSVIGRLVAEYGKAAELAPRHTNPLSPHDLRRTMARNAYDNGASLLLVQQALGHSDPKTTARYIGAYEDDNNTAIDLVNYDNRQNNPHL